MALKLGFIGFGEAGHGIVEGIVGRDEGELRPEIAVWDILFSDADRGAGLIDRAKALGVQAAGSPTEAMAGADFVFSAVTTDQSLVAAKMIAADLPKGVIYLDLNSTSPGKKKAVAEVINGAGGHMVEAAVMDSVPPHKHCVPMLLAGPKALDTVARLAPLGMQLETLGGDVGQASTIKMCRSVFMKGMPALLMECLVAAEVAGVRDTVLSSIGKTYPGIDWEELATRSLAGTALHAGRRAGEMREVAVTLEELGVEPIMAPATADQLQACADLGLRELVEARPPETLSDFLDHVRTATDAMLKTELKTGAKTSG